jgi:predicted aldo/keto reductase-like oxidoreductase
MRYRPFGKTGASVSVLGFGTARFPLSKYAFDMDLVVGVLRRAFELGINYVDTSEVYSFGRCELAIGRAIEGQRDNVFIATKNNYRGESGDEWQQRLEGSLERLGVDWIDFYHLHGLRWKNYRKQSGPGGPLERFRRAKQEGLVRHLCFSSHDRPENIVRLIDTGEFEGVVVQYNLLDRSNEGVIAHAHERGLGVAVMGPVGGGRLSAPSERIQGMIEGGRRTPEIALRFVLSNPHVTLALSGMTTVEMVEQNVATAGREQPLSKEERRHVLRVLEETQGLLDLYCTGCGYCMPCPHHVDIPKNLDAMNVYRVWGLQGHARALYQKLGKKRKRRDGTVVQRWAQACVECGECVPKCPQDIPIVERLRETASTLGLRPLGKGETTPIAFA